MSVLSLMEDRLPPGFRFYPKDEELVCHYLAKKVAEDENNSTDQSLIMVEVDLNKNEPWDLPETARVGGKEWYFYSLRDRKYATGIRRNRATASGYWKATGKDRHVTNSSSGMVVGMRKTLVFYQGRAPRGRKTDWVMHEFRLEKSIHPPNITFKDWVLCRVFHKSRGIPTKQCQDISFDGSEQQYYPLHPSILSNEDHDQNLQQSPFESLEGSAHMTCISNFTQNIMSTDPFDLSRVFPSEQIMPPRIFSNVMEPLLGMGTSFFHPFVCEKRSACAVLDQLKLDGNIYLDNGSRIKF